MAPEVEEPGFLSRWSRRKALQRHGLPSDEPARPLPPVGTAAGPVAAAVPGTILPAPAAAATPTLQAADPGPEQSASPARPAPTLADVALLDRDSDFSRFVSPGVQPEVRNAALSKLFSDPHFNVMDGLDVYIDDYGKPDPLPPGMLRQMVQSHMLGLFDDEHDATAPSLPAEPAPDEDTDLQLQPDDDAGRASPEAGAGEHAGRPH
jgi:hypothetical protein